MKFPNLVAAAIALAAGAIAIGVATGTARQLESRYIHALAPRLFSLRTQGSALQAEALRHPDLLLLYGSSELNVPNAFHASALFRDYPTGFTIFPVGKAETTSLIILQKLAALGDDLRGKKIAISLSPGWLFLREKAVADSYAGNFSRLQAGALAFEGDLSFDLKRAAAKRMLEYPATLESDPLLKYALEKLAGDGPFDHVCYTLVVPLGRLQNAILRLQDHWANSRFIRSRPRLVAERKRVPGVIDWNAARAKAEAAAAAQAGSNPYGFNDLLWKIDAEAWLKRRGTFTDTAFVQGAQRSKEWLDLDLLLRAVQELGAKALVLSMPNNGLFFDELGTSAAIRQAFYARLHSAVEGHHARIVTFADHDYDKYFLSLPNYHLSEKGWVHYDHALDSFFHEVAR